MLQKSLWEPLVGSGARQGAARGEQSPRAGLRLNLQYGATQSHTDRDSTVEAVGPAVVWVAQTLYRRVDINLRVDVGCPPAV